jgi:hypothetical protein
MARMGAGAVELARLYEASIDQPADGPLYGRPATADLGRDRPLPQETPAELVGVHAEEAKHLKVAAFEPRVGHGARRNDGISSICHSVVPWVSGS